jgi:murein DD-endopeptidase MepM/ murein hydrolase activator NlpD
MKYQAFLLLVCLPLRFLVVTSPYGPRIHPVTGNYSFHDGVDLRADHDTVFAVAEGRVTECRYDDYLGNYIKLDHGDWQSGYGHLGMLLVARGDSVYAGYPIAISGYVKPHVM